MSEARFSLDALEREARTGAVETVITALPDLFGRLVGKRITAGFFLDEVASHGMHVCDYLLACDMEMDATPGYAYTSWESGYGDLHAVPDLGTLRHAAWLDRTALVRCDAHDGDGGLVGGHAVGGRHHHRAVGGHPHHHRRRRDD